MPQIVKELKSKGYKLVTVSKCIGLPAYQSVGKPQKRDVSILSGCLHAVLTCYISPHGLALELPLLVQTDFDIGQWLF